MSQILLYGVMIIGLAIALPVVLATMTAAMVFLSTRQLQRIVNTFFSLIALGKIKEAYQSTAFEFQANTSQLELVEFLQDNLLMNFKKGFWLCRSLKKNQASLERTITNKVGQKIKLKIYLRKEDRFWKIYSIEKMKPDIFKKREDTILFSGLLENGRRIKPIIPTEIQAKQIVYNTLISLSDTVETNNFAEFYDSISLLWQKQTSVTDLESAFQDFLDQQFHLSGIAISQINLIEPPIINENNWLQLHGQVPNAVGYPSILDFNFQYIRELETWKLVRIKINIEKFKTEAIHNGNGKKLTSPLQWIVATNEFQQDFWADRN
ncbi:MAG: hypothetical protein SAK29_09210 [Scytonema sp. PMC 1069.18]|nr:hypothetical protein [Scytonema sp. PMC 1069.18]MEC4881492.1 hypothetical protein [Scytonema sp. PMC 1070.18]